MPEAQPPSSVQECLAWPDPLAPVVADFLLNYREEDATVDYKLKFDATEREWLEITKDVVSFSNAQGGYLVFGVKNQTWELLGIAPKELATLSDTNKVIQKLNRFVSPPFFDLRTKEFQRAGMTFAVWCIPDGSDLIRIVTKDGSFEGGAGSKVTVLRRGTIWIRGSAGNRLADSNDLDAIFRRRLDRFRDTLMENIARVVEGPAESQVFLLTPSIDQSGRRRFTVADAPEGVAEIGMTFGEVPSTPQDELDVWIGMEKADSMVLPAVEHLWAWYADRESIPFSTEHEMCLARFALLLGAPAFYWLRGKAASEVKEVVKYVVRHPKASENLSAIVATAAFLGQKFHRSVLNSLGALAGKLPPAHKRLPCNDPRSLLGGAYIKSLRDPKEGEAQFRTRLRRELDSIALKAKKTAKEPPTNERYNARHFDCALYAQDDCYAGKRV